MALRLLQIRNSIPAVRYSARYHDYVRFATQGTLDPVGVHSTLTWKTGGIIRIPLNSPKVIGVANSRGNRRYAVDSIVYPSLTTLQCKATKKTFTLTQLSP